MAASISLVITTYNRARFLGTAIESVLQQTYRDFELLIWDDGSTDASVAIARTYAQQDARVRVMAAPHLGRGLALKLAMAQVTGQYFGWVDDDDQLAPTALAETVAALDADPEIGVVYTDYIEMDEQGTRKGRSRRCDIPYSPFRLLVDFMVFHFRLIRRSVYDRAGGVDPAFEYIEDYELCLRLSEVTKIQHLAKPLYFYRIHPHSITQQRRHQQIALCQKAIHQALQRRHLDAHFKLSVQMPGGRFLLCRKRSVRSVLKAACLPLVAFPIAWAAHSPAAFAQEIVPARDGTGTVIRYRGHEFEIRGGRTSRDGANLFHSFERFGLSRGEIANFLSRPEIINILGRVTGGDASYINGLLRVTGGHSNLFLMNPAGIVFGPNASLDVPGSFAATTATGIRFGNHWFNAIGNNNYDWLNGNPNAFAFTVDQPGVIVNAGNLSVPSGENLSLVGGTIVNTGELSASSGQLTAMAVPGQSMVRLSHPGNVLSLQVPIAPGSQPPNQWTLPITALPQLLTSGAVGQDLGLQVGENGQVALVDSGTPIPTTPGTTIASGQLDASNTHGGTGGTVQILGNTVGVVDAQINATGTRGGGTVLVGGDYRGQGTLPEATRTFVTPGSTIDVSALNRGDGGRAIIWSNGATTFQGEAIARGGRTAGNGGLIETSGLRSLGVSGTADASAPHGETGTWLLDPTNVFIGTGYGYDGGIGSPNVDVAVINQALNAGTNVTITTAIGGEEAGNITQQADAPINKTGGPDATLTLQADSDITLNSDITSSNNRLNINLNAGEDIFSNGTITSNGGNIALNAGDDIFSNGIITSNGGNIIATAGGTDNSFLSLAQVNAGRGNITLTGNEIDLQQLEDDNSISGTVTGTGDLTLQPVTPTRAIAVGGLEEGGEIDTTLNLSNLDLGAIRNGFRSITIGRGNGSGAITINGGTASLFSDPVTIRSQGAITQDGNFTVNDNASIAIRGGSFTSGLADRIQTQGGAVDLSIGTGNINAGNITTNGGDATLRTQGDAFSGDINFNTINSGGGAVDIVAVAGAGYGYGNILGNGLTSQGGDIRLSATNRIAVAPIRAGSGDITLTGNEIDFRNRTGATGPVSGTGNLRLQPTTSNLGIVLGGTAAETTALDLDTADLASLQNGFRSITIGQNSGSGAITVLGRATPLFRDPVTFAASNASITVNGSLIGEDNASFTLNGPTTFNNRVIQDPEGPSTTLNAGITTAGQNITINGATTLNADTTLNTGSASGGDITLNRTVNGPSGLTLTTGTGQVTLEEAVGNTAPLTALTVNGAVNLNGGSIRTTGDQTYTEAVTLGANTTLSGNDITFNSTVRPNGNGPYSLDINTIDQGVTTFNGDVGGISRPLSRLTTNADGRTVIAGDVTTSGNTIRFDDPVTLNGDVALRDIGSGDIIFNSTVDSGEIERSLTVRADNGGVDFNGSVGGGTPLSALTVNAENAVTLAAPITTTGPVNVTGATIQANDGNASQMNTNGGDVNLRSTEGDIEVGAIATEGGDITVNSSRFFRAVETLLDDGSPTNTSLDAGGGSIFIRHTGGRRESPVEPFVVGDASRNGTAGNITSGTNSLTAPRSFPDSFSQGDINIRTDDIPSSKPSERPKPPDVSQSQILPPEAIDQPGSIPEFTPPTIIVANGNIAAVENNICQQFQRYFGSETFGELAGGQNPCEKLRTPEEITALLGTIAAQAGRRAAIIYLLDRPTQLELVAFFPDGQPVRRVVPQIDRETLLNVVQEFRDEVNPDDTSKLTGTSYLASAQQLYRWLIAPLEADLQSHRIDTLAFIPDAGLRALPFAALHDGQQFLVEKYSVGLLPSINLIDPRYQSLQGSEILAVGSGKWQQRGFELNDLPSVPIEVSSVVQQPWQGETLLDDQFTLNRILTELNNPSFRVLHLATHGEFQPGQPNDSYIQFWNNRLGLSQLQQLQLRQHQPPVELLTLSACRTALGDNSAELGFAGLALAAGAKSALASLWYVSDVGTLSLMTEFYRELAKVPIKAEALQRTQIAMLRGEVRLEGNQLLGPTGALTLSASDAQELSSQVNDLGIRDLSHPFFWAAFTMVGSPW